jgi:3-deoxy-D-manno-octulosonic-acid transferase
MLNRWFYRLGTGAYFTLIKVSAAFNPKAKLFISGRKQLLPRIKAALEDEQRKRIWVHCASLGEFEQGRPVIEALKEQYPQHAIVLTFFSPSGYEVRKRFDGVDYVFYLPLDTPSNARAFLDAVQPTCCIFIKYELWYYYLNTIKERQIPALLVSAAFRKSQGFFKWYGGFQRSMLQVFKQICVQDETSRQLLLSVGISNVLVTGDTRFDRVVKARGESAKLPLVTEFCKGHRVIVAGSTWPADEALLREAMLQLPNEWKLILVPHEVDENHIKQISVLFDDKLYKWTTGEVGTEHRVLLIDTIGMLSQLYRYANIAWIGGGFGKAGVHNVLEAAVYGVPVAFGPIHHQFREVQDLLNDRGATVQSNANQFVTLLNDSDTMRQLVVMGNKAATFVQMNTGATEAVMAQAKQFL